MERELSIWIIVSWILCVRDHSDASSQTWKNTNDRDNYENGTHHHVKI